ncbi:hypothetical protein JTE90_003056 [Oedothorax gibbosus]|uniref:Sugar phosphate phosphatase n=1 Tax=Oedothorax gibbosus TaxID=931172 RepID=A0AAV6VDM4_9ARAC|nr:hypothetical protein JTE90_003056 [Oedothorax gibbosus]
MSGQINNNKKCLPAHYSGKFKGSFAYLTIKDRLPVILVKVVDVMCQSRSSLAETYGEVAVEDSKAIVGRLSALQNEMVTNKLIKPLVSDGPDVDQWNDYLNKQEEIYGFQPAWFESSWLYAECYFYRRIKQAFELSSVLKDFDPFHKQKEESLLPTMDSVAHLCSSVTDALTNVDKNNKADTFNLFKKFLEASLWGNRCDLSISAGKENVKHSDQLTQLDELRTNILANDIDTIWQVLQEANYSSQEVNIDFVLDNAGFELFCDLCFMHFLQSANLVNKINIHVKTMPWFVSDTLEKDIHWLLETLAKSNNENLINFSKKILERLESRDWVIVNEGFWTLPHDYSEMKDADLQLYERLSQSDLIILKGDLNYRKLTGDRQWEETTPFRAALNGFEPTALATLRTIKADVVVGLKTGISEKISTISENWKFTGDYAVIQCFKKNCT